MKKFIQKYISKGRVSFYIVRKLTSCAVPLSALLFTLSSCSDWDNHYENEAQNGADLTLWDAIKQRSDLSDFAQVLENTMVFRQHKKTSVSYADVLKGGRSFTIFAPVNGTFNKDSILSLVTTAKGDSAVERFFIKNHLSQNLVSADGTDKKFRLLNFKNVTFTDNKVNDVSFKEWNIHSKNGIMHVMNSQLPYRKTIYEALISLPQFKSNGEILASYNEDVFDEDASVSSGIEDGKKVYVDSVVYETNKLINAIGYIDEEDSTFHVSIPTEEGWNKAFKDAMDCYTFPKSNPKADSLQRYYAYRALMDDAVFSQTTQVSMNDSVRSLNYDRRYPQYSVYYKPFNNDGIFGKAKERISCSNGTIYATDEWAFDPAMTYQKKIVVEGESNLVGEYNACTMTEMQVLNDSVSKGRYTHIKPSNGNSNWSVTYGIKDINTYPQRDLTSGKYDIKVVVLPKSIAGGENKRPCRFTATINYIDEDGNLQHYKCNDGSPINSDPYSIDAIKIATFKFPTCNYGQNGAITSITLTCSIRPNENSKYDRNFYLDAIVFERSKE